MKPNNRWIAAIQALFVIAVAAMFAVVRVAGPADVGPQDLVQTIIHVILPSLLLPGLIGVFVIVIRYGLKHGIIIPRDYPPVRVDPGENAPPKPPGFPVVEVIPEYKPPTDGPGKYRIEGVDRETKMDTTLHLHVERAANAKVKAEPEGVVVTSVVKED